MKIIPYMEIDGCRTLTDNQMIDLYKRMKEEGTAEKVFYGSYSPKDEQQFLGFVKSPLNSVFVATDDKPVMIAWVNETLGLRGTISFCTFKGPFLRKKIKAGRIILSTIFNALSVVVAIIPEEYLDVRAFCKMVGFKEIGIVPSFTYFPEKNKAVGGAIAYITPELMEAAK